MIASLPETEQMAGVVEARLTARPEVAVALNATVPFATKLWSAGSVKLMLWLAGAMAKLWLTCGAGV